MTIFFTSDTHFGHKNIITLGKGRPFNSIEEHDETLIANWNAVVKPGDVVFHLGDFSLNTNQDELEVLLKRLNGAKHLILGNHDRVKIQSKFLNNFLWQSIRDYHKYMYEYDGITYRLILKHFPILEFDGAFKPNTIHLYGHIHNINKYDEIYKKLNFKALNVSSDVSSEFPDTKAFSPISFESILLRVKQLYGENND